MMASGTITPRTNLANEPTLPILLIGQPCQRANLANLANLANWYFTDFYQFLREGLIKDQSVATFVGYEYDVGFRRSGARANLVEQSH
jgi:hypothetical protein